MVLVTFGRATFLCKICPGDILPTSISTEITKLYWTILKRSRVTFVLETFLMSAAQSFFEAFFF